MRRLLPPPPPVPVERKPVLLGPIRWIDVAGRVLSRTWSTHWRRQYVEILPLTGKPPSLSPPLRPPRAVRSHHHWSWQDRLDRNAWSGPPRQRISITGLLPCEPVTEGKHSCCLSLVPSLTLSFTCLHLVAHPVGYQTRLNLNSIGSLKLGMSHSNGSPSSSGLQNVVECGENLPHQHFPLLKKRVSIRVCHFIARPSWFLCGTDRENREGYSYYCPCYDL